MVKAYKLELSEKAAEDLFDIKKYILINSNDDNIANEFMEKIKKSLDNLCDFPEMAPKVKLKIFITKCYRYLIIENYIAIYSVNYSEKIITIIRVINGKKDYIKIL